MASAFGHAALAFGLGKSDNNYLLIAIAALLNFLLLSSISDYGLALSVDSANYFSVAESLARGQGFFQFDDFPFLNAPPLYPILISPAYILHVPVEVYAVVLQLFQFNLFLFFQYKLIKEELKLENPWLYLWLSAGFYFVFVHVFVFALSEAGFVALLSVWFYLIIKDAEDNRGTLVFALLCLQRYAIWLILPGIIVYWLSHKKTNFYMIKQVYLGVVLSGVWWLRNFLVSGKLLGEHRVQDKLSLTAIYENCSKLYELILSQRNLAISSMLFLCVLIFGIVIRKHLSGKQRNFNLLVLLVSSGYLLFLLFQKNLSLVQLPRYLAVLWPLLLLLPSMFLNGLNNKKTALVLALVFLIPSTIFCYQKLFEFRNGGDHGYHSKYWQEMKKELKMKLPEGNYISNFPDMLWWITGRHCHYTPFIKESDSLFLTKEKGEKMLVWFNNTSRNHIMQNKENWFLKPNADTLLSTKDFTIYRIKMQ